MGFRPLPHPDHDADELQELLRHSVWIELYRLLYESRAAPLLWTEIAAAFEVDHKPQGQLARRLRQLYPYFEIAKVRHKGDPGPRYVLMRCKSTAAPSGETISLRTRAEVLQFGRCAQCGRSPRDDDEVVLEVDHKIPKDWGGHPTDRGNLQALCRECNAGKKAYYATFDTVSDDIAAAAAEPEVHRRIGELLRAASPNEVRNDVLEFVSNMRDAQEDWQKRLRELRVVGWDYTWRKQKDESGRVRTYYRLIKSAPWPDGSVSTAIKRGARATKASNQPDPNAKSR